MKKGARKKVYRKKIIKGNIIIGIGIFAITFYAFLSFNDYALGRAGFFIILIGIISILEGSRIKKGKDSGLFNPNVTMPTSSSR